MKKLLISLTVLFSIFVGINSVSAEQGTSISPISKVSSGRYNTYLAKIQETGKFLYYPSYYNKTYYFGMGNNYKYSDNRTLFSVETDYPELISIGSMKKNYDSIDAIDYYEILLNVEYDENKPVYLYYSDGPYSSYSVNIIHEDGTIEILNNVINSTGILIEENMSLYLTGFVSPVYTSFESSFIESSSSIDNVNDSYYFFTTNYDGIIYYKNINSNIESAKTLNFSSTNTLINEDMPLIYKFNWVTKDTEVDKIKLKYKTGFVSSEAYNVLGKVSVEFSETDTNIYKYKKSQFKLQFGSNDFSKEYIPVFSHYKVFGKRSGTWTELSDEKLKFPYAEDEDGNIIYDDRRLVIIDTTYDYSDGMLADASITFEINYSNLVDISTTDPIYTDWKIEFYFDNTDNGYIYVYDTLNNSTWTDTAKFLEDYIFYYFPPGYRYAFISSEESSTQGRIYFPSNHYQNTAVRIKGYYYHYLVNWIGDELERKISEDDQYYSYFDYNFKYDDKKCVALSRKSESMYFTYYDPDFLNNYLKLFPDEYLIYDSEMSYFYAPIGAKVIFSKSTMDDIIIHTPDGVVKNDSNTIYDTTDYDIQDNTFDNVDDLFSHVTNFFKESIPYMKPLIDLFTNFYNSLNEYAKAFIEFFAVFILLAAVLLWLDRRSDH